MTKKANLLWIDLEMTGLDPARDRILEIAAIATDWDFNQIATYEAVVKAPVRLAKRRMVGDFWDKYSSVRSALQRQNITKGRPNRLIEKELLDFLLQHFDLEHPVYLAGNSIYHDRKFITQQWPRLDSQLHYRMLDVSAWKILFENKLGKKFTKPEAHRAMSDIRGSIEEIQYYLKALKK